MSNYKIINYENKKGVNVNVRFDEENNTIWLTQSEIALIFDTTKNNIIMHIKKIMKKYEGGKYDLPPGPIEILFNKQKSKAYNFDVIEDISLRSNSISGYEFIKWAKEKLQKSTILDTTELLLHKAVNPDDFVFKDGDFSIQVMLSEDDNTFWLNPEEMALIFERDEKTIRKHIQNIFDEGELDYGSNSQKMRLTTSYRPHILYSFKVLLAVGYRVKSERGTKFRIWATNKLEEYSINGYVVNDEKVLINKNIKDLYGKVDSINERLVSHDNKFDQQGTLNNKYEEILTDHTEVLKELTDKKTIFKGMLLYEGDFYTGYSFAKQLMLKAKERIILIDGKIFLIVQRILLNYV